MKTNKNSKLKGSVLFTVVSVMSLLIIFLTGTLVLAASANKRAHRTYCTSQAEYTARAAIESFTEAMKHNPDISGAVINLNGTIYPYVEMDSSGMGKLVCDVRQADGSVVNEDNRIKVEKLSDTNYYYTSNGWEALQTVKVTATAKVGKEEKSVSLYIRKKAPNDIKPSPLKGLQTAGGNGVDSTAGIYTGALVLGALQPQDKFSLKADVETRSDFNFINGDFHSGDNGSKIYIDKSTYTDGATGATNTCGTVVMGDLTLDHGSQLCSINYQMTDDYDQTMVPYLFVNGRISTSATVALAVNKNPGYEAPFNVFAGSVELNQSNTIDGDLYLMDANAVSIISNGSNLANWVSSTLNKTNSTGGSVYSKGSLMLNEGALSFSGNLRIEKDLQLNRKNAGQLTVGGDIVVGGSLIYTDKTTDINGAKTIYCDSFKRYVGLKDGYTMEEKVIERKVKPKSREDYIAQCDARGENGREKWIALVGDEYQFYSKWGVCLADDGSVLQLATHENDVYDYGTIRTVTYKDSSGNVVTEEDATNYEDITAEVFEAGSFKGVPVKKYDERPAAYNPTYPASMERQAVLGEPGFEQYKIVKTIQEIRESLNITLNENTGEPEGFNTSIYPKTPKQLLEKIGMTETELEACKLPNNAAETTVTKTGTVYLEGEYNMLTLNVEPGSDDVWIVFKDVVFSNGVKIFINDKDHPVKCAILQGNKDYEIEFNGDAYILSNILLEDMKDAAGNVDLSKTASLSDTDKVNTTWYACEETGIYVKNPTAICGTAKMPYTIFKSDKSQGKVNVKYTGNYKTDKAEINPVWVGGALFKSVESVNNFEMAYCEEGGGSSSSDEIVTAGGTYIISHYDMY